MKYAPILAVDSKRSVWKVVGIILQNRHGVAFIRLDEEDPVVIGNVPLRHTVESFNEDLEEGELTFYERDRYESASHIGRLSVSDDKFIAKFRERLLAGRSNIIAIGEDMTLDSENVMEHVDTLLIEVKKLNGLPRGPQTVSRG